MPQRFCTATCSEGRVGLPQAGQCQVQWGRLRYKRATRQVWQVAHVLGLELGCLSLRSRPSAPSGAVLAKSPNLMVPQFQQLENTDKRVACFAGLTCTSEAVYTNWILPSSLQIH